MFTLYFLAVLVGAAAAGGAWVLLQPMPLR
jgi:hypothetical protein